MVWSIGICLACLSLQGRVFKQESGLNGTVKTDSKRVQGESREKEKAGGKLRQKVTGSAIWRGIFHSARARPNNNNGLTEDDGRQFPATKPSIHPSIHEATPRGTRDSRELCLPTSNERIGGPGKHRGRVPISQCAVIIAHSPGVRDSRLLMMAKPIPSAYLDKR